MANKQIKVISLGGSLIHPENIDDEADSVYRFPGEYVHPNLSQQAS